MSARRLPRPVAKLARLTGELTQDREQLLLAVDEQLYYVQKWWFVLLTDRSPGRRSPRRRRELTDAQREKADRLAREERDDRAALARLGLRAIGPAPAPAQPQVLDTITDLSTAVMVMVAQVRGQVRIPSTAMPPVADPAAGQMGDARTRLAIAYLRSNAWALPLQPLEHLARESRSWQNAVRSAIGDTGGREKMKIRCPLCGCSSLVEDLDHDTVTCISNNGADAPILCVCNSETCGCASTGERHTWVGGAGGYTMLGVHVQQRRELDALAAAIAHGGDPRACLALAVLTSCA